MNPSKDQENLNTPHDLNATVLRLPCYEPAGSEIELTGEALTRNTLLTGAIGSGKTSTLSRMLSQLISYRADEPEAKIGLLIFDFKDDNTAARVRAWAEEFGRGDDVEELSAESDTRLELFDTFHSLADLEEVTESLLTAVPAESSENRYWESARRKRLESMLGIYRLANEGALYGPDVMEHLDACVQSGGEPANSASNPEALIHFNEMVEAIEEGRAPDLPEQLRKTINRLKNSMDEWRTLDCRTRSNEQSTMTNLLHIYTSYSAYDFFGGSDRRKIRVEDVVDKGKIIVVTLPALRTPQLASTIGRWMKSRFFSHLHSRCIDYDTPGRLAGLIMDEYPLVATRGTELFSDITHLQAMRAMRGFAVAATQGFEALFRVLGAAETRALLGQFDQHFFFQSKESAVAELTESLWGREAHMQRLPIPPESDELEPASFAGEKPRKLARGYSVEWKGRVGVPELASLEPGEAWVWSPCTRSQRRPHWLVPLHQSVAVPPVPKTENPADWEKRLRLGMIPDEIPPSDKPGKHHNVGKYKDLDFFEDDSEDEND